jgi:thioredoxin reductase (NADPH)
VIKLTIVSGPDVGGVHSFSGDTITIGRSHACDVVLSDDLVSKRHCTITRQDDRFVLTDHSTNGTFLNDLNTRIETHELLQTDEILLGKTHIRLEWSESVGDEVPTRATPPPTRPAGAEQEQELPPTRITGAEPVKESPPASYDATASLDAIRQPNIPIVVTVVGGPDRGMAYSPAQEVLSIGRAPTCDIVLHDPTVSRLHATIKREVGKYRVYDENSKTGISLRTPGARVFHEDLADGDIIYLGQTQLRVDISRSSAAAASDEEATIISGNVGGKDFTFTLALPVHGSRKVPPEGTLSDTLVVDTAARVEEATHVLPISGKAEPRLTLRVVEGPDTGATFTPQPGATSFAVGRGGSADFRLQDRGTSRVHFTIEATPTGFVLTDKESLNGTFVNQSTERVSRIELKNGDEIRISETRFTVELLLPDEATVVSMALPPSPTQPSAQAGPAPIRQGGQPEQLQPDGQPEVEDVQSRSAAFKERLAAIVKQKGVSLRPFTMPGTPRQWAALALMLLAVVSSYGFLVAGKTDTFSGGPLTASHAEWGNACATCHPAWGFPPMNATCVSSDCHASVLTKGKDHVRPDPVRAQVRDDCVSCHTEHRGPLFNIKGGAAECWSCHREGLQRTPLYQVRRMHDYHEAVFLPAAAIAPRAGAAVFPFREEAPGIEQQRQALLQRFTAQESGLRYAHAKHGQDVLKKYGTVEDCTSCHALVADDARGQSASQVEAGLLAFPSHAQCIGCHEHQENVGDVNPELAKAKASEVCLQCHLQQDGGSVRIQRSINYVNFTHQTHTRVAGACRSCHAVVLTETAYRPVLRTATLYPVPMDACVECHEQTKDRFPRATVACLDCHGVHHNYATLTEIAGGWLGSVSLASVFLVLLAFVAGAGAYTYADMRIARKWLESITPPPEEPAPASGPAPPPGSPGEALAPVGEGGILPFPTVDASTCISCSSCYDSCPTNVLAGDHVTHKSVVVNPNACKSLEGCTICQDGCPTGAIRVTSAPLLREVERAQIDEHSESNLPGLFLAGEVVGAALIKKAVNQGDQVVRFIADRKPRIADALYDVIIIGAGPAGLGAGLEAKRKNLRYLLLERATVASTIRDYPRDKAVLAEPVLLPQYGLLPMKDAQKESLIEGWEQVIRDNGVQVNEREEALEVQKTNGLFTVTTTKGTYHSAYVVLCIGTRGNPRKIGVSGEDLPKVAYNLIDAGDFRGKHVLVVGGGDSAIEAAVALSKEPGTTVTLSYRRGEFSRIKSRNADAIAEQEKTGRVKVIFNSSVTKISEKTVSLKVGDEQLELENDAVFALIGADPPKAWLEKIGVNIVTIQEAVGAQW